MLIHHYIFAIEPFPLGLRVWFNQCSSLCYVNVILPRYCRDEQLPLCDKPTISTDRHESINELFKDHWSTL